MSVTVTALTGGLLAILYVVLSARVSRLRMLEKVGIGHGGSHELRRAIRAHANFSEYVPFALLMLFLLEMSAMFPPAAIWSLGVALFASRLLHAIGMSRTADVNRNRMIGSALMLLYLLVAGTMLAFIGVHNWLLT